MQLTRANVTCAPSWFRCADIVQRRRLGRADTSQATAQPAMRGVVIETRMPYLRNRQRGSQHRQREAEHSPPRFRGLPLRNIGDQIRIACQGQCGGKTGHDRRDGSLQPQRIKHVVDGAAELPPPRHADMAERCISLRRDLLPRKRVTGPNDADEAVAEQRLYTQRGPYGPPRRFRDRRPPCATPRHSCPASARSAAERSARFPSPARAVRPRTYRRTLRWRGS